MKGGFQNCLSSSFRGRLCLDTDIVPLFLSRANHTGNMRGQHEFLMFFTVFAVAFAVVKISDGFEKGKVICS